MGKITLTVEGTTVGTVAQGGGVRVEKTVSEQDSARLIAAMAAVYGMPADSAGAIGAILEHWFSSVLAASSAQALDYEKQRACEAVLPIVVT